MNGQLRGVRKKQARVYNIHLEEVKAYRSQVNHDVSWHTETEGYGKKIQRLLWYSVITCVVEINPLHGALLGQIFWFYCPLSLTHLQIFSKLPREIKSLFQVSVCGNSGRTDSVLLLSFLSFCWVGMIR